MVTPLAAVAPGSAARHQWLDLIDVVGVFVCALAVRLLYLAQDSSSPFFWHALIDASDYHKVALLSAQNAWPASEALFRPPLYPLLLGSAYRWFGDDIVVAKVMQAVLGSVSCVLVYLIGRAGFGARSVARLAAALCAFCGTLVYYDGELLSANLDVFLLLIAVLAAVRAAGRPGLLAWALAGAAVGLGAINRGSVLLFVPLVLLWILRRRDDPNRRASQRLLGAAVFLLPVAAIIAPLVWHNARFDELPEMRFAQYPLPLPTPGSALAGPTLRRVLSGRAAGLGWADGINAYMGNNPEVQEINRDDRLQHFEWFAKLVIEPWQTGVRTASGHSRYFMRKTLAQFLDHPGACLRLLGRKALQVVNGTEVPRGRRLYAERTHSSLLSLLLWRHVLAFPSGVLLPLSLVGLWLARASWRRHGLIAAALAAQVAFLLGFFVTARYRAPALPLVALYAAYALVEARKVFLARRLGVPLALAGLLVVANLPLDPVADHPSAVEEHHLGTALQAQGRLDAAIVHYRAALLAAREEPWFAGLRDGTADIHYNLGTVLHRIGELDEAMEHYRSALSRDPENHGIKAALEQALTDAAAVRASRQARGAPSPSAPSVRPSAAEAIAIPARPPDP